MLANKLIKNIPNPRNAREHYKSFIIKENRKSVKQSDIVDVKSVITEHPKTSHKLSKTKRKAKRVGLIAFCIKIQKK